MAFLTSRSLMVGYHEPGDELQVGCVVHLLLCIGEDKAAAGLQTGGNTLAERRGDGVHGFLQEHVVRLHVRAVVGPLVEKIAELRVGSPLPEQTMRQMSRICLGWASQNGCCRRRAHRPGNRLQRVDGLGGSCLGSAGIYSLGSVGWPLLPEAKNDAGRDRLILGVRRHYRIEAEGRGFEGSPVGLDVFQEFEAEVVKRELGEGDTVAEVFDVEDFILEAQELLVTVTQVFVDEFLDLRILENVVPRRWRRCPLGPCGLRRGS